MAVTLVSPDDMFKFSRIEQLIDRELDKLQPPSELGEGPQWRSSGKGSGRSRGPKPAKNEGRKERPAIAKQDGGERKPKGDKKPRKEKAPSQHRLMYDALPNPKKGKPAGEVAPTATAPKEAPATAVAAEVKE